jgi:hypothetical protein
MSFKPVEGILVKPERYIVVCTNYFGTEVLNKKLPSLLAGEESCVVASMR